MNFQMSTSDHRDGNLIYILDNLIIEFFLNTGATRQFHSPPLNLLDLNKMAGILQMDIEMYNLELNFCQKDL